MPQKDACSYGARVSGAMFYNYFRSSIPTSGKYTQADPIRLDGGCNRFNYVDANPLRYSDPRGLNPVAGGPYGAEVASAFGPDAPADRSTQFMNQRPADEFVAIPEPSAAKGGD